MGYISSDITLKETWRRYERDGHRFYHNRKKVLAGITTILKEVMPTSYFLQKWLLENGEEELQRTADYGSLLHLCIERFLKGEHWWLSIPPAFEKDAGIRSEMVGFRNFQKDCGIKPLLIEVALKGNLYGCDYACTIDLLCKVAVKKITVTEVEETLKNGKIKIKKEKKEETVYETWIIDFKSNYYEKDKSFYSQHVYQLMAQKKAVLDQTGVKVDRIFNWTSTKWIADNGSNTYKLVEWVEEGQKAGGDWNYQSYKKRSIKSLELYMKLAKNEGANVPHGNIRQFKNFVIGDDDTPSVEIKTYEKYILGQ